MPDSSAATITPKNRTDWRNWLIENHHTETSVWVIHYKQHSEDHNMTWSEAVDEALCFGWIDSTRRSVDDDRYIQFFSRRKPKSTWSKINKDKVDRLIAEGLMTAAGQKCIDIAKSNGSWTVLDNVEALVIPEDLEQAFSLHPEAKTFFLNQSKSVQKMMLHWITFAKRTNTRESRIEEIISNANLQQRPKQFR